MSNKSNFSLKDLEMIADNINQHTWVTKYNDELPSNWDFRPIVPFFQLGVDLTHMNIPDEVNITVFEVEPDDKRGVLTIKNLRLQHSIYTQYTAVIRSVVVSGFKKQANHNVSDLQKLADKLNNTTWETKKTDIKASDINNDKEGVSMKTLGVNLIGLNIPNDIDLLLHESVANDDQGELLINRLWVTNTSNPFSYVVAKNIKITKFQKL